MTNKIRIVEKSNRASPFSLETIARDKRETEWKELSYRFKKIKQAQEFIDHFMPNSEQEKMFKYE